jgi:hypothetical protein
MEIVDAILSTAPSVEGSASGGFCDPSTQPEEANRFIDMPRLYRERIRVPPGASAQRCARGCTQLIRVEMMLVEIADVRSDTAADQLCDSGHLGIAHGGLDPRSEFLLRHEVYRLQGVSSLPFFTSLPYHQKIDCTRRENYDC